MSDPPKGAPASRRSSRRSGRAWVYPWVGYNFATSRGPTRHERRRVRRRADAPQEGGCEDVRGEGERRRCSPKDLDRWRKGVELEDGVTLPAKLKLLRHEGDKTWIEVTIREGRNQQLRRMGEATGFPVMRLARVSFAGVTAEGCGRGEWRSSGRPTSWSTLEEELRRAEADRRCGDASDGADAAAGGDENGGSAGRGCAWRSSGGRRRSSGGARSSADARSRSAGRAPGGWRGKLTQPSAGDQPRFPGEITRAAGLRRRRRRLGRWRRTRADGQ